MDELRNKLIDQIEKLKPDTFLLFIDEIMKAVEFQPEFKIDENKFSVYVNEVTQLISELEDKIDPNNPERAVEYYHQKFASLFEAKSELEQLSTKDYEKSIVEAKSFDPEEHHFSSSPTPHRLKFLTSRTEIRDRLNSIDSEKFLLHIDTIKGILVYQVNRIASCLKTFSESETIGQDEFLSFLNDYLDYYEVQNPDEVEELKWELDNSHDTRDTWIELVDNAAKVKEHQKFFWLLLRYDVNSTFPYLIESINAKISDPKTTDGKYDNLIESQEKIVKFLLDKEILPPEWISATVSKLKKRELKDPKWIPARKNLERVLNRERQSDKLEKTKTELLEENLWNYGFFELPEVATLSEKGQKELVKLLSQNKLPYCIAMFDFLGFLTWLEKEHFTTKDKRNKAISSWFESDKSGRSVKGYINSLSRNPDSKDRYKAYSHKESVKKDYENLK